ncbi:TcpE family conjugal transfer membrane protein [Sphaerisporangium sp. NPDC051011]|uniref:TcpE family conjugal transfer membrane protein n=1 Tax=Sphaerisporangium sp. NPDC051011 TaxID=3155792 RepID=UPI0033D8CF05
MDLPTYTNIWRIEKRLYKLYDLRLPMPLPIVWIGVFLGVLVPWSVLLAVVGVPFEAPWHVVYLVPPGIVTWLSTRPVIESKRLNELLQSQLRYLGEPKTWCRLAPAEEPDEITFTAKVWRTAPGAARAVAAASVKSASTAGARSGSKSRRGNRAKPKHTAPRRRPLEAFGSARQVPSVKRGDALVPGEVRSVPGDARPVPGEVRPAVAAAAAAVTTLPGAEAPALMPSVRGRASGRARGGTAVQSDAAIPALPPSPGREGPAQERHGLPPKPDRLVDLPRTVAPRPAAEAETPAAEPSKPSKPSTGLSTSAPEVAKPARGLSTSAPEVAGPARGLSRSAPEVAESATGLSRSVPEVLRPVTGLSSTAPEVVKPVTGLSRSDADGPKPVADVPERGAEARPGAPSAPAAASRTVVPPPARPGLPPAPMTLPPLPTSGSSTSPASSGLSAEAGAEAGSGTDAASSAPAPIGTEALRRLRRLAASAENRDAAPGRSSAGAGAGAGASERMASHEWPTLGHDRPASTGTGEPVSGRRSNDESDVEVGPNVPSNVRVGSNLPSDAQAGANDLADVQARTKSTDADVRAESTGEQRAAETLGGPETPGAVPAEASRARAGGLASEGREQHRKGQPPRAATPREGGRGLAASRPARPEAAPGTRAPVRGAAGREQVAPPLSIRAVPGTGDPAVPSLPVPVPRPGDEPRVRRVESVVGREQSGGWRRLAQVVVGGGAPSRNDGIEADEARARTVLNGSRRVVVLGCTGGAGQTTTTLMLGHTLARYREDRVLAVDANTGDNTLTGRIHADSPESLTSLMAGLDGVSGYLSMRAYTTRCESGLEVVGSDADAGAARRLADRRLFSDERLAQAMRVLDRHYRLILVDPAAAVAARMLAYADQLILVAPASEDAPDAVAMTFDWLDGQTSADLRRRSVMVINGVSRRSMAGVEQAEAVARGRCRAIVRIPWEDELAPGRPGPAQPSQLRAGGRRAYVALAGVVASGLAAASRPSEEEVAQ